MWVTVIVMAAALCGGIVQSVAGFGGAIIMMIFLPAFFSMTAAPAVSDMINMTLCYALFWRYRKSINYKMIIVPSLLYLAVSMVVINESGNMNTGFIKLLLGVFLILLAMYLLFFSGKMEVKASWKLSIGCAVLAGVTGGLFGITGPIVSLYYLAAVKEKEEYLGTINAFFTITGTFNVFSRIYNGFLSAEYIPGILLGIVAIQIGCRIGGKIVHRLDLEIMRKCVYGLMILSGVVSVVQGV